MQCDAPLPTDNAFKLQTESIINICRLLLFFPLKIKQTMSLKGGLSLIPGGQTPSGSNPYQIFLDLPFLADRTNGRAYATVLRLSVRLSVCRLWRYVLWLNGAS